MFTVTVPDSYLTECLLFLTQNYRQNNIDYNYQSVGSDVCFTFYSRDSFTQFYYRWYHVADH